MFLCGYCSSVPLYQLFLRFSVPLCPLPLCSTVPNVPLCLLFLHSSVPAILLFLCTDCSSISTVPTGPLYLMLPCAYYSSVPLFFFYYSVIRSVLEFSCQLFHRSLPKYLSDDIERIQRRAMRIIFPNLSYCEALNKAGIPTLSERRESLSLNYLKTL